MIDAVAFSDLDGTLLDHDTYDWRPAESGMAALRDAGIPLVLASSKTRAEMEIWRERLANADPFIVENGGAAFVPLDHPGFRVEGGVEREGYRVLELGVAYPTLCKALLEIAAETRLDLLGFHQMTPDQVAGATGLSGDDLVRSMKREYDEPFLLPRSLGAAAWARVEASAGARGLRATRGGRFGHLLGTTNKGAAARRLIEAREEALGHTPVTLACGDAENDLEMLASADHAIVVRGRDGRSAQLLHETLPLAVFTQGRGPAGFSEGVLSVLERIAQ